MELSADSALDVHKAAMAYWFLDNYYSRHREKISMLCWEQKDIETFEVLLRQLSSLRRYWQRDNGSIHSSVDRILQIGFEIKKRLLLLLKVFVSQHWKMAEIIKSALMHVHAFEIQRVSRFHGLSGTGVAMGKETSVSKPRIDKISISIEKSLFRHRKFYCSSAHNWNILHQSYRSYAPIALLQIVIVSRLSRANEPLYSLYTHNSPM